MSLSSLTAADLIAFERRIADQWEAGDLPCLLHLSGGNESHLLDLFRPDPPTLHRGVLQGDWIFSTHRNHYHALLAGIPAEKLEADIAAGRSMFVYSAAHNFLTSSVLAGTCAIAAGVAFDLKRKMADPNRSPHVWCFLGDGAEEEGHFYEAALFVEANGLPCTFIIEDNDRQVDTPKAARRGPGPDQYGRADAHGPLDHFQCVRRYHYTPTFPHAGSGCAHKITFKPEAIARLKP
jgi:TPP-dependent pyruvate/acetoin dehydrogenase alpha subunit